MYSLRPFTQNFGALIQRITLGHSWSRTLTIGLVLLLVGGIGVGASLMSRARQVSPAAHQPAQALQVLPQSVPQADTTAYYLRAQEEQAIRTLRQSAPQEDTTAYYLRGQEEQAVRNFWQHTAAPDTTAYYLRAQEEQAVRDFWARAVTPDTTAYYLRAQEEQAVRTFRESHP
jgi:hypothetical protein